MSFLSSILERISSILEKWRIRRQEEKERRRIERERQLEQQRREEEQRRFLYRLGNDFEDFVIGMFDPEKFELIHRTPTNDDTNGRFVHSMVYPDLRFREIYITYLMDKTVTFNADGESCLTSTKTTDARGKNDPLPEATREGYRFGGWYTGPEATVRGSLHQRLSPKIPPSMPSGSTPMQLFSMPKAGRLRCRRVN